MAWQAGDLVCQFSSFIPTFSQFLKNTFSLILVRSMVIRWWTNLPNIKKYVISLKLSIWVNSKEQLNEWIRCKYLDCSCSSCSVSFLFCLILVLISSSHLWVWVNVICLGSRTYSVCPIKFGARLTPQ